MSRVTKDLELIRRYKELVKLYEKDLTLDNPKLVAFAKAKIKQLTRWIKELEEGK